MSVTQDAILDIAAWDLQKEDAAKKEWLTYVGVVLDRLTVHGIVDARREEAARWTMRESSDLFPAHGAHHLGNLFDLLAEHAVMDPFTDAALLFLTQQRLTGAHRRYSWEPAFDAILAWQKESA